MDASTWPIQPVTRRWTTGVLQETDPLSRRAESIYGCASEVAWPDDFPLRATGPVHGAPVNTGRLPDALSVLSPGRATMAITVFVRTPSYLDNEEAKGIHGSREPHCRRHQPEVQGRAGRFRRFGGLGRTQLALPADGSGVGRRAADRARHGFDTVGFRLRGVRAGKGPGGGSRGRQCAGIRPVAFRYHPVAAQQARRCGAGGHSTAHQLWERQVLAAEHAG
ncbi:Uncharacterised protein [Mycobacteroides abscessus subsp. abscessus]|nr:Uncharacterised protein [Mycobacteroides abscessus subsp. abscessus]